MVHIRLDILDFVVAEFTDNLAWRFGAPGRAGAAAPGPVQVGAALGGPSLRRRHAARPQAGRAGRAAALQHAVFGLGRAPVHGLKKNRMSKSRV